MADSNIESISDLVARLHSHPDIKQILLSDTVESTLYKIISDLPDITFMDLGKQGFDLLELLRKNNFSFKIVITGEDKNSAIKAIQSNIYDFLLKPVKYESVIAIINQVLDPDKKSDEKRANKQFVKDEDLKLRLSSVTEYIFVDPREIVYCESSGSYTRIFMDNGSSELVNYYLGKVISKLPTTRFYRISRFHMINLEKLLKINRNEGSCILMMGKEKITIQGAKKNIRDLCNIDF